MTKHLTTVWLFLTLLCGVASAAPPAACQNMGLWVHVDYVKARDADTIEVRVHGSAFIFAIRLIDVWAPETDSKDQKLRAIASRGKSFTHERCRGGDYLTVFVPFPATDYPLKALTFDRVPAWVFVGDEEITLNEQIVKNGLASSSKKGRLGE